MKASYIPILLVASFLCSCSGERLRTVPEVDLSRYAGTWHEIATIPSRFQKGCECTTAHYTVENGYVAVRNRCFRNGRWDGVEGKATVVEGTGNAELKVQFFWPFSGGYFIIGLADDYSHALVGHPSRDYLWVLSRSPTLGADTYQALLHQAAAQGFDTSRLVLTRQGC